MQLSKFIGLAALVGAGIADAAAVVAYADGYEPTTEVHAQNLARAVHPAGAKLEARAGSATGCVQAHCFYLESQVGGDSIVYEIYQNGEYLFQYVCKIGEATMNYPTLIRVMCFANQKTLHIDSAVALAALILTQNFNGMAFPTTRAGNGVSSLRASVRAWPTSTASSLNMTTTRSAGPTSKPLPTNVLLALRSRMARSRAVRAISGKASSQTVPADSVTVTTASRDAILNLTAAERTRTPVSVVPMALASPYKHLIVEGIT